MVFNRISVCNFYHCLSLERSRCGANKWSSFAIKTLGFNTEKVLIIERARSLEGKFETFANEIRRIPQNKVRGRNQFTGRQPG